MTVVVNAVIDGIVDNIVTTIGIAIDAASGEVIRAIVDSLCATIDGAIAMLFTIGDSFNTIVGAVNVHDLLATLMLLLLT